MLGFRRGPILLIMREVLQELGLRLRLLLWITIQLVRVNLLLSRIQPELRITVDAHRSASLLQNILRALRIILLVGSNSRNLPVLPINHIVIGVCVELDLSLSNL